MSLAPPATAGPAASGDAVASPPAETDRRFTAFLLDRVLGWGLAAVAAAVGWWLGDSVLTGVLAGLVTLVVVGLVLAIQLGATGRTPGKAAVGLRVVRRTTGRPIGVAPALGRTLVLGIAGLPTVGLGWATLAWTAAMDPSRRRRALHDRIGDAIVVDVRARPVDAGLDDGDVRPQQLVNLTAMRLVPAPPVVEMSIPTPAPAVPTPPPAPRPAPAAAAAPAAVAAPLPPAAPG
ncbi:RDD family protein, partial [Nocardioides ginsengisoli]